MKFDKEKLIARIKEDNKFSSLEYCENIADDLINSIDSRLEKNLEEYIDNDKITDIYVDDYCINAILSIRNNMGGVLDALLDLNVYAKDKEKGKHLIWNKYEKK